MMESRILLIVSACIVLTNAFHMQTRITTLQPIQNLEGKCQRNMIRMMLPGNYRFVLNTPLNKRSSMPLEAGTSNTDLIKAEGSGSPCRIKVIGVGGGGGNAVNRMIESSTGVAGVELWVVNTDAQALSRSMAPRKLNIGNLTSRYLRPLLHLLLKLIKDFIPYLVIIISYLRENHFYFS
jgi:hypothetical protein